MLRDDPTCGTKRADRVRHSLLQGRKPGWAEDGPGLFDVVREASEAASSEDTVAEDDLVFLWTVEVFCFDADKDCDALADHLGSDSDGAPADAIGAPWAKAIAHKPATGVFECAGVVAEKPAIAMAKREGDVCRDCRFIGWPGGHDVVLVR